MELIAIQRAIADNSSVVQVPPASLHIGSSPSSTSTSADLWINGFWFTSLTFSLSTALIAVLVKQWLQAYVAPTFQGSPKDQGRVRHFRYLGIEQWHVPLVVGLLPILFHLSLFLFFNGLIIFMFTLHVVIGGSVSVIVCMAYLVYGITNMLPLWDPQCPYKTPLSTYAFLVLCYLTSLIPVKDEEGKWRHQQRHVQTLKEMEERAVLRNGEDFGFHMFGWLCQTSSNPSVRSVILQVVEDLPTKFNGNTVLAESLLLHLCKGVDAVVDSCALGEQLSISAAHMLHAFVHAHLRLLPISPKDIAAAQSTQACSCFDKFRTIMHSGANDSHLQLLSLSSICFFSASFTAVPYYRSPNLEDLLRYQPRSSIREWISLLQRGVLIRRQPAF